MHLFVYLLIVNFIQVNCLNDLNCNLNTICETAICEELNTNDCLKLDFYTNNEQSDFALEKLELLNNSVLISFDNIQWKSLNLKLSQYNHKTNNFCLKLTNPNNKLSFSCLENYSDTVLLELLFSRDFDVISKKFIFNPNSQIFSYIEFSDTYHLILKIQPLPEFHNISTYKVEIWREKHNQTTLQDLRLISANNRINGQIHFDYYTYNEEGNYYFTISVISDQCLQDSCPKTTTPIIFIGRKRPILVIGIVGASLILPFVLFLFHVLTKKYKNRADDLLGTKEQLLLIYQSTNEKNTNLVNSLAKLLKQLLVIDVICDVITNKKLCEDLVLSSNYICCLNLPDAPIDVSLIKQIVPTKNLIEITFDLGQLQIDDDKKLDKKFKLIDEFEDFLTEFRDFLVNYDNYENNPLFIELKLRIKEAKLEAEKIPQIYVSGTDGSNISVIDG